MQPALALPDPAPRPPAPALADPNRPRIIHVHFPISCTSIDPTLSVRDKSRWTVWSHMPVDQAMTILCRRLDRAPWDLSCRENEAREVIIYVADPRLPEAIVMEGFTGEEGRAALKRLAAGWRRQS